MDIFNKLNTVESGGQNFQDWFNDNDLSYVVGYLMGYVLTIIVIIIVIVLVIKAIVRKDKVQKNTANTKTAVNNGYSIDDSSKRLLMSTIDVCYENIRDVAGVERIFILLWNGDFTSDAKYGYLGNNEFMQNNTISTRLQETASQTRNRLVDITNVLKNQAIQKNQPVPTAYKIICDLRTNNVRTNVDLERVNIDINQYYNQWMINAKNEEL